MKMNMNIREYLPFILILSLFFVINKSCNRQDTSLYKQIETYSSVEEPLKEMEEKYGYQIDVNSFRGWHSLDTLSNGAITGQLGAVSFLLDDNGKRVSSGYHEWRVCDDGYITFLGADEYKVDFRGKVVGVLNKKWVKTE